MCVRVFVSGALYFGAKQPIVLAKQISLLFQQKKTISRKRGLLLPKSETRRENNSEPYISAQKSPMFGKSNKPFISLKRTIPRKRGPLLPKSETRREVVCIEQHVEQKK